MILKTNEEQPLLLKYCSFPNWGLSAHDRSADTRTHSPVSINLVPRAQVALGVQAMLLLLAATSAQQGQKQIFSCGGSESEAMQSTIRNFSAETRDFPQGQYKVVSVL